MPFAGRADRNDPARIQRLFFAPFALSNINLRDTSIDEIFGFELATP